MEESGWREREVEVKRVTDEIKNKCYIGIRGIYTTNQMETLLIWASNLEIEDCK